ncbi:hypothetical protein BCR43DRAFT_488530 [Syncephalastrum racemosum]|uniref:Uncharacterized protein n=1 Tax=Syncephalastrum racemosum TaxID=13706 RepID=A0A1X2HIY9_SYNRA|nr:hypothetical protein BCR43DRAFT_488530 [Syncephalastrum racemosum]
MAEMSEKKKGKQRLVVPPPPVRQDTSDENMSTSDATESDDESASPSPSLSPSISASASASASAPESASRGKRKIESVDEDDGDDKEMKDGNEKDWTDEEDSDDEDYEPFAGIEDDGPYFENIRHFFGREVEVEDDFEAVELAAEQVHKALDDVIEFMQNWDPEHDDVSSSEEEEIEFGKIVADEDKPVPPPEQLDEGDIVASNFTIPRPRTIKRGREVFEPIAKHHIIDLVIRHNFPEKEDEDCFEDYNLLADLRKPVYEMLDRDIEATGWVPKTTKGVPWVRIPTFFRQTAVENFNKVARKKLGLPLDECENYWASVHMLQQGWDSRRALLARRTDRSEPGIKSRVNKARYNGIDLQAFMAEMEAAKQSESESSSHLSQETAASHGDTDLDMEDVSSVSVSPDSDDDTSD